MISIYLYSNMSFFINGGAFERVRNISTGPHGAQQADDALPEPDEGERLADGGSARTARARAVRDQPDDRSPSGGAANVQLRPLEL